MVSVWPNLELEDGSTQLGGSGRVSRGRRSMSKNQLMKTGARRGNKVPAEETAHRISPDREQSGAQEGNLE